jgi:hypothetical protein
MVRDNPCVLLCEGPSVLENVIITLEHDVKYFKELRKNMKGSFVWKEED